MAAAVILDPARPIAGLADSKLLSAAARSRLDVEIRGSALAWALGAASVEEIDTLNILCASLLAMERAVAALPIRPELLRVDGVHAPRVACRVETVIGGDRTVAEISAASIIAKVARDAEMVVLDARYPAYGFGQHKGYPTPLHLAALAAHGPCPVHRRSFAPVRRVSGSAVTGAPV